MSLKLDGRRRQRLHAALLSAFPQPGDLAQMVSFQLNESLNTISLAPALSDIVFDLIRWAEARGMVERLVIAARSRNPGNEDLRIVAEQLGLRITVYQGSELPQVYRAK